MTDLKTYESYQDLENNLRLGNSLKEYFRQNIRNHVPNIDKVTFAYAISDYIFIITTDSFIIFEEGTFSNIIYNVPLNNITEFHISNRKDRWDFISNFKLVLKSKDSYMSTHEIYIPKSNREQENVNIKNLENQYLDAIDTIRRQKNEQDKQEKETKLKKDKSQEALDTLKKYKELLDLQIITKQEFLDKKEELINLI